MREKGAGQRLKERKPTIVAIDIRRPNYIGVISEGGSQIIGAEESLQAMLSALHPRGDVDRWLMTAGYAATKKARRDQ
jgi:hypothetical protein